MGIIKRTVSAKSNRSAVTIIAEGNRFYGDTTVSGKMHVDGFLEGNISSSDDISIGKTGVVSGRIRARQIFVSGVLEGDVICEELHIERSGKVRANACCQTFTLDPQGCFLGERRLPEQPQAFSLPNDDVPGRVERLTERLGFDSGMELIDSLPDRITLTDKKA